MKNSNGCLVVDDQIARQNSAAASDKERTIAGLFAGIGGFEIGFAAQGYRDVLLCDADPAALRVLRHWFPETRICPDVRSLRSLPQVDVLTAGFPCQDLSQVGSRKGIDGPNSGLIGVVIDLLRASKRHVPRWLVLENVPFMLRLHKGRAMKRIVDDLESMGWAWAYRTIDTRSFGLPQRRRRVVLLASREHDPRGPLLDEDAGAPDLETHKSRACGFYWTEGNTGLGWAVDAVPPLKGGSGVHIPSPPAIWFPRRRFIGTPSIQDAERLQGFPSDWTKPAEAEQHGLRRRWRLVGNAVSVPLSAWLAARLNDARPAELKEEAQLRYGEPWPAAAWGVGGKRGISSASEWPSRSKYRHLAGFLEDRTEPLSLKATQGFLDRLKRSSLQREEAFEADLERHARDQEKRQSRRSRRSGR